VWLAARYYKKHRPSISEPKSSTDARHLSMLQHTDSPVDV
jgi:hypothetical protein